jgi:hypothetical protein
MLPLSNTLGPFGQMVATFLGMKGWEFQPFSLIVKC